MPFAVTFFVEKFIPIRTDIAIDISSTHASHNSLSWSSILGRRRMNTSPYFLREPTIMRLNSQVSTTFIGTRIRIALKQRVCFSGSTTISFQKTVIDDFRITTHNSSTTILWILSIHLPIPLLLLTT